MDEFLALSKRFSRFGLTQDDIRDAIKSACDFFNLPQPRMIQDLTNTPGGQTMFVNWDRGSYYDDVLCFNMQQLIDMKVDSKEAFSLVMTHECCHRVLQNTQFYGPNSGAWEQELSIGIGIDFWQYNSSRRYAESIVHQVWTVSSQGDAAARNPFDDTESDNGV